MRYGNELRKKMCEEECKGGGEMLRTKKQAQSGKFRITGQYRSDTDPSSFASLPFGFRRFGRYFRLIQ